MKEYRPPPDIASLADTSKLKPTPRWRWAREQAAKHNLTGVADRVLHYAAWRDGSGQGIFESQESIATQREVNASRENVNRAFNKLVDLGVLIIDGKVGRTPRYRLNISNANDTNLDPNISDANSGISDANVTLHKKEKEKDSGSGVRTHTRARTLERCRNGCPGPVMQHPIYTTVWLCGDHLRARLGDFGRRHQREITEWLMENGP